MNPRLSLDVVKPVVDTPLVFNDTIDTVNIKNILLIDSLVSESQLFFDSANSDTFPIIYSYNSNRTEFSQLLDKKFSNLSLERIAFVFHDNITDGKVFLNQELMFLDSDILENVSTFSPNTQLLIDTIQKFNVKHIDFLACNSLNYLNWKGFYSMLTKQTSVVVGASNDKTGNLNYGGNWVMENTNENVANTYFNSNIQNYTSSLASTLGYSGGTTLYIQQSGNNIQYQYNSTSEAWTTVSSWPVTIVNNTPASETILTVQFTTNITISSNQGLNGYFITGSNYITYDGYNNTVTISDVPSKYPGLIQNGTETINGKHAITVKNINTASVNSNIQFATGWICQYLFGYNIKTISGYVPILIDNCSNSGDLPIINGYEAGGIVGAYCFHNGYGIIQNCYNTGNFRTYGQGGICGAKCGRYGGTMTITNCYNTGNISGAGCGGISGASAGNTNGTITITNCYNTGTIISDGGGIMGYSAGVVNGTVTITNCYNMGAINGDYAGGITGWAFGRNSNNLCSITNCYNFGNMTGLYAGGICGPEVGWTGAAGYNPQILIQNCYSLGNIGSQCGGILAGSYGDEYVVYPTVNISNCYTAYDSIVDSDSQYVALSLQFRNSVIKTNVYTQFISSWSDTSANSDLTDTPTSIANPGTTWKSVATNTPYNLTFTPPVITSISTSSGSTLGGTSVTITGTNFTGASKVTFDGLNATSINVVNSTTITCITPAHSAGAVGIIVTTGGIVGNTYSSFTYITLPVITSISPSFGTKSGGTSVTITGTYFTVASAVTIGGISATNIIVFNSTKITCKTPVSIVAGGFDVIVTTGNGPSNTFSSFTYIIPPVINSISQPSVSTLGGTSVTITGTSFTGATEVTIGGLKAKYFSVVNDTTIICITPARSAGAVSIIIKNSSGLSNTFSSFTYIIPPKITIISPSFGSTLGGTIVTITGTAFTEATVVTIGGTVATSFNVINSTTITFTTPASNIGVVGIIVTTEGVPSNTALSFTYITPPNITSISPSSGSTLGANSVTITGTDFTGASAVTFGGLNATSFKVVSSTTITCITPAGISPGDVGIIVRTGGGPSNTYSSFTYITPPIINSISPSSGSTLGGTIVTTSVTITGTYFTGATTVTIGKTLATNINVVNDTTITCTPPAHAAGDVGIIVTTGGGPSNTFLSFTYITPAKITGILPLSGSTNGGTSITIKGTAFTGTSAVTIGGLNATSFSVVNATIITCITPASNSPGPVGIIVTTVGGPSNTFSSFTYITPPVITSISPSSGSTLGANSVTITGTDFTGASAVTFGGLNAKFFKVVNNTTITCITPASISAGDVGIIVRTVGGLSNTFSSFTYITPPVITSISPSSGSTLGGTSVTITGTYFTGASAVTFGKTIATNINVVNDTTITCTPPASKLGPVGIIVTTVGGLSNTFSSFTYITPPVIASILPLSGSTLGGTSVTIKGTAFTGASAVTFGGLNATSFSVVNATIITCITPASVNVGAVGIIVTTIGGPSNTFSSFTYMVPPVITSISPSSGTKVGGTIVTITGTDFTGATTVTCGGKVATNIIVVNSTTITCKTPASITAGAVGIIVTTGGGPSNTFSSFTYI